MADASVGVADQVRGKLLRLPWLEPWLLLTRPAGRGRQIDQQTHGSLHGGRIASRLFQRGIDLLPVFR